MYIIVHMYIIVYIIYMCVCVCIDLKKDICSSAAQYLGATQVGSVPIAWIGPKNQESLLPRARVFTLDPRSGEDMLG